MHVVVSLPWPPTCSLPPCPARPVRCTVQLAGQSHTALYCGSALHYLAYVIVPTNLTTHTHILACSIPIDDAAYFGRWKDGTDASTTLRVAYLKQQSPAVLAVAAGYSLSGDISPKEAFFHERFCVGDDLPGFDPLRRRVLQALIHPLLLGMGKVRFAR